MCHVLWNVNQSYFALFVVTLKILLQIWFRKICSLVTLVIALAKELLTLILKFDLCFDIFLSPVEESWKRFLRFFKIPELGIGNWKILWLGSSSFEWRLFLLEGERTDPLNDMIYPIGVVRCSYRMWICLLYYIQLIF